MIVMCAVLETCTDRRLSDRYISSKSPASPPWRRRRHHHPRRQIGHP